MIYFYYFLSMLAVIISVALIHTAHENKAPFWARVCAWGFFWMSVDLYSYLRGLL